MEEGNDISKIIGLIMKNPDIIERIKSLANEDGTQSESNEPFAQREDQRDISVAKDTDASRETINTANDVKRSAKDKRQTLLSAIKPYVSTERGRAIDTMLSVLEVFDIMKAR